jgi:hypothetical protein
MGRTNSRQRPSSSCLSASIVKCMPMETVAVMASSSPRAHPSLAVSEYELLSSTST